MSTAETVLQLRQENATLRDLVAKHEARIQKLLCELKGKKSEKLDPDELLEVCRSFFTQEELDLLQEAEPDTFAEPDLPDPPGIWWSWGQVGYSLGPKPTTDFHRDHFDRRFWQLQDTAGRRPNTKRALGAGPNCQPAIGRPGGR